MNINLKGIIFFLFGINTFAQNPGQTQIDARFSMLNGSAKDHFFYSRDKGNVENFVATEPANLDFALFFSKVKKKNWRVSYGLLARTHHTKYADHENFYIHPYYGRLPRDIRYKSSSSTFLGLGLGLSHTPVLVGRKSYALRLRNSVQLNGFYVAFSETEHFSIPRDDKVFASTNPHPNNLYLEVALNLGIEFSLKRNGLEKDAFGLFFPVMLGIKPNSELNPFIHFGWFMISYGGYF